MDGEVFLKEHLHNLCQQNALQTRMTQCRLALDQRDELTAALALNNPPIEARASGQHLASRTECLALSYEDDWQEYADELTQCIRHLRRGIFDVQQRILLFDAVMAGLDQQEQWLVTEIYVNKTTIERLAEMKTPAGLFLSVSTISRHRKKLLEKVELLLRMCHSTGTSANATGQIE